jgi:hypothetical protein
MQRIPRLEEHNQKSIAASAKVHKQSQSFVVIRAKEGKTKFLRLVPFEFAKG